MAQQDKGHHSSSIAPAAQHGIVQHNIAHKLLSCPTTMRHDYHALVSCSSSIHYYYIVLSCHTIIHYSYTPIMHCSAGAGQPSSTTDTTVTTISIALTTITRQLLLLGCLHCPHWCAYTCVVPKAPSPTKM